MWSSHQAFTGADLDFLKETVSVPLPEREELHHLLDQDDAYRRELFAREEVFSRVCSSDDSLAFISPRLYFEVLLRRVMDDLRHANHTVERSGGHHLPVFDTEQVIEVVSAPAVLDYLVKVLASFTRVRSYTVRVLVRRGIMHKVRYSDMDVHSLLRLLDQTDEPERLPLYQRIADLCLFVLGVFPDYPATANRYPGTGALRPRSHEQPRLNTEEYEALGQQMYAAAAEHEGAEASGLTEPLQVLKERIIEAKKPLNYLSEHYLRYQRHTLFGQTG